MRGFITRSRLTLEGYLGDVPEMKYTPSGKAVIDLSLGVGGNQAKGYASRWYKVTFWQEDAELINGLDLRKGNAVAVAGNLVEADVWQATDGSPRGKVKLGWVDELAVERFGKVVNIALPSAEGNGKRPVEAVAETETGADEELALLAIDAREVLGEGATDKAIAGLMAGKGSVKILRQFADVVEKRKAEVEPEDIPF